MSRIQIIDSIVGHIKGNFGNSSVGPLVRASTTRSSGLGPQVIPSHLLKEAE